MIARRRVDGWLPALLAVTVVVTFLPVLDHGFINYDDTNYVTKNPFVQQGITRESVTWAFRAFRAGNWHPLTWLSHMIDVQLYGVEPRAHHATSLALHAANTVLVFLFLRSATQRVWVSAAVAAVFGVHPLRVESVAWVAERKDVLSSFFALLSLCAYVRYARRPGVGRYLVVMVAFVGGLLAKPMVVTLPAVFLLLDYWPLRRAGEHAGTPASLSSNPRASWARLFIEKLPLVVLSLSLVAVTIMAQQSHGYVRSLDSYPLGVRVANALVAYLEYVRKLVWPSDLALPYPHPGRSVAAGRAFAAAAFFGLVCVSALRWRKRHPYVGIGWCWFLVMLVPVVGLVQVGTLGMADRYTYLPLLGLTMAAAWGLTALLPVRHHRWLAILCVVIILVLSARTRVQLRHWESDVALWGHALATTRKNWVAHSNLGRAHLSEGRLEAAAEQLTLALALKPDQPQTLNNLGIVRMEQGRWEEALRHFERVVRLRPDLVEPYANMGRVLLALGRTEEAIGMWRQLLRLEGPDFAIHYNLALVLLRQGRSEEARHHAAEALRLRPGSAPARALLERTQSFD